MKIVEVNGKLHTVFSPEEALRNLAHFSIGGISYYEDYYVNGCHFTLMLSEHHTSEEIEVAKAYLHANRDVVGISVGFVWIEGTPMWFEKAYRSYDNG